MINSNSVDKLEGNEENSESCRVYRGSDGVLYFPCLCSGSIKYVHQECLKEWIKIRGRDACELCKFKYSFQPIYRADMPRNLPTFGILKGVTLKCTRKIRSCLLYATFFCAWFVFVPLFAVRFFNLLFCSSLEELVAKTEMFLTTDRMDEDVFTGFISLTVTYIFALAALRWLTDEIAHNELRNIINQNAQEEMDSDQESEKAFWSDLLRKFMEGIMQIFTVADFMKVLKHSGLAVCMNSVLTIAFVFVPYRIGSWTLAWFDKPQVEGHLRAIVAFSVGYVILTAFAVFVYAAAKPTNMDRVYRFFGNCFLAFLFFVLVLLEKVVFVVVCGCWIDLCSLKLFSATIASRLNELSASPKAFIFSRWICGGMSASTYNLLVFLWSRRIVRMDVFCFAHFLNHPQLIPEEVIKNSTIRHLCRLLASLTLFITVTFFVVYFPIELIARISTSFLPYHCSPEPPSPLYGVLVLEILNSFLFGFIRDVHFIVEQCKAVNLHIRMWYRIVGKFIGIDKYILEENVRETPAAGGSAGSQNDSSGKEEPSSGLPRGAKEYIKPRWFLARLVVLICALLATWALGSVCLLVIPVLFGRIVVLLLTNESNVDEIVTLTLGIFACWMTTKLIIAIALLLRNLRNEATSTVCRSIATSILKYFIVPLLSGAFLRLSLPAKISAINEQTTLWWPCRDWMVGIVQFIIVDQIMTFTPPTSKRQKQHKNENDLTRERQISEVRQVLMLVILFIPTLFVLPCEIERLRFFTSDGGFGVPLMVQYSFPLLLCIWTLYKISSWLMSKLKRCGEDVRDEIYLVDSQLVNNEKDEEKLNVNQSSEAEILTM